ncbi:glycosyltransferase family 61 protein [Paracoccus shandongensis]|uniref:glycosyltransferase family 61 protein n=1 Tax=Paracoccus shandongensis TaxID=2816048 RepID=UPI001A8D60F2|nr:glycosyltransferase family 61 protein [Paracoccus shandongensis]
MSPFQTVIRYKTARLKQKLLGYPIFADLPEPEPTAEPRQLSCRAGLYEPDQLSRVLGCNRGVSLAYVLDVWTQTKWIETPISVFRLGPATIIGGVVATKTALHWMDWPQPKFREAFDQSPVSDETVIANSLQGLRFFGHWLGDDCTAYEEFRDHPDLRSMRRPKWNDLPFFEQAFDQHWQEDAIIRSNNLVLLRALGFDRRKAQHYRSLRKKLRKTVPEQGQSAKIVYIRRGASAKPRAIVTNEEMLIECFSKQGVEVVTPEGNAKTFAEKILDASIIISVEGSQACHAIYALREGGALLVLQPPDQVYSAAQEWMRTLDLHSGMVIGKAVEGGFTIDPDEVLQMVDRLLALTENREAC